jgi:hypothetical protein
LPTRKSTAESQSPHPSESEECGTLKFQIKGWATRPLSWELEGWHVPVESGAEVQVIEVNGCVNSRTLQKPKDAPP